MAQKIVTLCDPHLADNDLEVPGASWSVTLTRPGGKPVSYTLDVCEEHAKPLAELNAYLHELGRPAAPVESSERVECPECGKSLKNRGTLSTHLRQQHGKTLTELDTGEAPTGSYVCPECSREFTSPQGIAVHRSRTHGVTGANAGKVAS